MTDPNGRLALAIVCHETCLKLSLCQKSENLSTNIRKQGFLKNKNKEDKNGVIANNILTDIKFSEDLQSIKDIFDAFLQQLMQVDKLEINVETLTASVEVLKDKNADTLNNLKLEVKTLNNTLQELKKEGQKQNEIDEQQLKEGSEDIINMRHKILTGLWTHNLEMKMLKRWKSNRLEILQIVQEKEHRALMNTFLATKRHISEEERLIKDISSFRFDQVFLLQRQLDLAKKRFEKEQSDALDKIRKVKQRIEEQNQLLEDKRRIYKDYHNFIDEFCRYKDEKVRQAEWERYRNRCATRLQAWWRGIMVRHGFGKYRKKFKKSKGKGKGIQRKIRKK